MTRSAGNRGVGAAGVAPHGGQRVAHGGKIYHARHARKILQQHARRHEADLFGAGAVTLRHGGHVPRGNALAIFVAQQILQENPDGKRQAANVSDALPGKLRETEVVVLEGADTEFCRGAKAVLCHWSDYI